MRPLENCRQNPQNRQRLRRIPEQMKNGLEKWAEIRANEMELSWTKDGI
jgi:hypothetical protein